MKDGYGELKKILEEVNQEATEIRNRMFHNFVFLGLLTLTDLDRIALYLHVCPASPVSVISHLERSTSRDEPVYLFPFHIIVFSMRSPRRLGTVAILPRYRTLVSLDALDVSVWEFVAIFCLPARVLYHLCKTQSV
jgi:hypothetical protein